MSAHQRHDYRPIDPELVAAKLKRVRNFEHPDVLLEITAEPRLVEVLWFLAFISRAENYAGGLRKFTTDLIADSEDLLGTATMHAARQPYSAEALYQIHNELPSGARHTLGVDWTPQEDWSLSDLLDEDAKVSWHKQARQREDEEERERLRMAGAKAKLKRLLPTDLISVCGAAAERELADYLCILCEQAAVRFKRDSDGGGYGGQAPWYFVKIAEAILRFIDRRKERLRAEIAETAVTREIFHWLGKAIKTKRPVVIEGNSRFGKTEAIRTWCAMNAGRARIVETPSSSCESDLLRAVAKALGLEMAPKHRGYEMRGQIESVLQLSGICLVFEESQFLYPANFNRSTMPARLNWVRRTIMDAGLPCAFICTPQSHSEVRKRYVKATGFAIEQFDGRILKTVHLPEKIAFEDLLAIARIHFKGLSEDYLEHVVRKAAATERSYCSDVSNIAALAFSNAEDAGRKKPNLDDIKAAIADVLPAAESAPAAAPKRPSRSRNAEPLQADCSDPETPFAGRICTPLPSTFEPVTRADSLVIQPT